MIRHIVLLDLIDTATDDDVAKLVEGLATLPERVPTIRGYSFGRDIGVNEGNATIAVVGDFDDLEGYVTYRDHPAHREVIEAFIAPVLAGRTAVQYEY